MSDVFIYLRFNVYGVFCISRFINIRIISDSNVVFDFTGRV